jgi:hypothetical protein
MKDLTGKKFGFWTVIKQTNHRKFVSGKARVIVWECKCECGTFRKVSGRILQNEKKPRSCGCSRKKFSKSIFESNYQKKEGCWNWKGVVSTHGYGRIGTKDLAHRRAYEYANGSIPKGMQVCHKCDNRLCVNPDHLFLGSIGDNMKDKNFKNRQAKGSQVASSKLTENQIREIRNRRELGESYQSLAESFNVGWYTIRAIIKKRSWAHV